MARKPKYDDLGVISVPGRQKNPASPALERRNNKTKHRVAEKKRTGGLVAHTNNVDKPLTEQQRMFVYFFVEEKQTQTASARLAGYSNPGTAAMDLMKNPKIQAAIAESRAEYAAASQMTKKKVIDGFLEAIELAKTMAEPASMVSGWREVGKMCGFYEPTKHEIKVSIRGEMMLKQMQNMTDEELLALAEQGGGVTLDGNFEEIEDLNNE